MACFTTRLDTHRRATAGGVINPFTERLRIVLWANKRVGAALRRQSPQLIASANAGTVL